MIKKFRAFAMRRPFLFGLALIVLSALLGTLAYPAHFLFPETELGQLYGDALAKGIIFLLILALLWRFGWLRASGYTSLGDGVTWLILALIAIYKVIVEVYAFSGDLTFAISDAPLAVGNVVYALITSFTEETMFRALALVAMVIAWGDTKQGLIKAIILSSLFFGVMHMFNILIRPVGVVVFQAIVATLPGILYAALLLSRKTIWPAIVLHWLTNAAVNIKLMSIANYEEHFSMWLIFAAGLIPLMIYSAYLIWKLPDQITLDVEEEVTPEIVARPAT